MLSVGITLTGKRMKINSPTGQFSVMRRISGRCRRGIRYALGALGEATTREISEWCYAWVWRLKV
jgi:hypothetical protein